MAEKNFFEGGGALYSRYRPTYPEQLAQVLADLTVDHALAVDVGCGNGQLSVLLAEHFEKVVATDASGDQIEHAAPRKNLAYRVERAEQIGIDSNTADLIVSAQAAHWFDLERFYQEAKRIAKADAALALVSYGVLALGCEADILFQEFYWNDLRGYWPPERRHVEEGYASLYFPFEQIEVPRVFIERVWNFSELVGYIRTWSAIRKLSELGMASRLEVFESRLSETWGDPQATCVVRWPITVKAAYL